MSKLPNIGTNIFSVMSALAKEHNAINLSQGFPDYPISNELVDSVTMAMKEGFNQYAPMPGAPALKKSISEVVAKSFNRPTDPENEIVITAGATESIYSTIAALVKAGDEVILFDPAYDSYDPSVRLNGGKPVHIKLIPPYFSIDWHEVRSKITPRTKMIIINTPHNPTGSVMSEDDMRSLEKLALEFGLIVLSDEVYERIIFD